MKKTAIKNFAVWARDKLIADITYKAGLIGVSEKGIAQPLPQSSKDLQFFDIGTKDYAQVAGSDIAQRNALVRAVQEKERTSDYKTAFKAVIEEVAYTWFNRLIAIRFMEVNEYLPSRIRVLSSENPAKNEPDFVTTPFDTDMEFTMAEQDRIMQLKDENKLDELFRMLFIKQCNKLHEILPELFEETNNYTELLLSISFTDSDGVVYHLVHDISENDFNVEKEGQVEIIGWMYQYYNIEPKDETFALLKKNVKITKERIPAATQLFTPDWIVRYMVENSLGRLWVEGHPSDSLKENWKYYLEEAEQEASVQAQLEQIRAEYRNLNPEDIKVIDPCMGSGHILVYCFDVLMQIYESQGYTQRDAAQSILENNLFGLDIDKRAAQLAYFAVMMKARQYDRRIFTRKIKPQVYAIEESNSINRDHLKYLGATLDTSEKSKANLEMKELINDLVDAELCGSILNIKNYDWDLLNRFVTNIFDESQITLDSMGLEETIYSLKKALEVGEILASHYHIVVTNPPYMGTSGMEPKLTKFIKDNYPETKTDLFACFIDKGNSLTKPHGFNCMVTMQSWMFLSSFEKMRTRLLATKSISSLLHMDNMVMGIAFGTAVTNFRNSTIRDYKGTYNYIEVNDIENGIPKEFPVVGNRFAQVSTNNFSKIPGSPIAYWVSQKMLKVFEIGKRLGEISKPRQGMATTNNNRFLRLWHEVAVDNIGFDLNSIEDTIREQKWYPYNKGGDFRKWYGNNDYVVNFKNKGEEVCSYIDATSAVNSKGRVINREHYFHECISWSLVSSGNIAFRYKTNGYIFDVAGMSCFASHDMLIYLLGLNNTKVVRSLMATLAPTINYQAGDIANIPVIYKQEQFPHISNLVEENIQLERLDWDCFEISWDFTEHPLVRISKELWDVTKIDDAMQYYYGTHFRVNSPLELCYLLWQGECDERFKSSGVMSRK